MRVLVTLIACATLANAAPQGSVEQEELKALLDRRNPEERARLERRLEALRALPQEERNELMRRARALRRFEKELRADAPEDLRRHLREQPEAGHRLWRDLFGC